MAQRFDIEGFAASPLTHLGLALMNNPKPGEALQQGLASGVQAKRAFDKDRAKKAFAKAFQAGAKPDEIIKTAVDSGLDIEDVAPLVKALRSDGVEAPSAVREYEYWSRLPEGERENFMNVKRAQQVINLGGTQGVLNPIGPGLSQQFNVTPKPEQMPEFQGAQTLAQEQAKARADLQAASGKKAAQASDVLNLAGEAEQYLDAGSGGLMNRGMIAGKQLFGRSDENTQAAAQLQVIGNRLVAAMPRMEGPQSNYDVQLYKDMAGRIADPGVPANDKRAALKALIDLNAKYANSPMGGIPGMEAEPAPPQMEGARQAKDGNWYVPDPNRPGKYLMVQP